MRLPTMADVQADAATHTTITTARVRALHHTAAQDRRAEAADHSAAEAAAAVAAVAQAEVADVADAIDPQQHSGAFDCYLIKNSVEIPDISGTFLQYNPAAVSNVSSENSRRTIKTTT